MATVITSQPPQPAPSWYQPIMVLSSFVRSWLHPRRDTPSSRSRSCEGLLKMLGFAPARRPPRLRRAATMSGMAERGGAGSGPPAAPGAGASPRSGLRALVVEDEKELAELIGSYLERDGFEVSVVHDGHRGGR